MVLCVSWLYIVTVCPHNLTCDLQQQFEFFVGISKNIESRWSRFGVLASGLFGRT